MLSSINALNGTLLKELVQASEWLKQQSDVRVVIVRGEGKYFCTGADVNDLPIADALPASGLPWHQRRETGQQGKRMVDALASINALTIAQVYGAAIGGGLLVMLACDFRVVSQDTVFLCSGGQLGYTFGVGWDPAIGQGNRPAAYQRSGHDLPQVQRR